jgi:hypothetical protein
MGMTVLSIGIAMIISPGPAVVAIPVGLAILAIEFAWARRWLHVFRNSSEKGAEKPKIRSLSSNAQIREPIWSAAACCRLISQVHGSEFRIPGYKDFNPEP